MPPSSCDSKKSEDGHIVLSRSCLRNFYIRSFNPDLNKMFGLSSDFTHIESDNSTVSSENERRAEKNGLSRRFNFVQTRLPEPNEKKYSLSFASNDIQKLIKTYGEIVDKVERRQIRASAEALKGVQNVINLKKSTSRIAKRRRYVIRLHNRFRDRVERICAQKRASDYIFRKVNGTFEGEIVRKQLYAPGNVPASNRDWRSLYAVLKDNQLSFYRDINYRWNELSYHDEKPFVIDGGTMIIETSSKKRRYLIRIRLSDDSEYILQVQEIIEWARWLAELNVTVKRYTPRTALTTPTGSSLSNSPTKSIDSTVPSTPASVYLEVDSREDIQNNIRLIMGRSDVVERDSSDEVDFSTDNSNNYRVYFDPENDALI